MLSIEEKIDLYHEYKEAYYNGEPLISDEEFDEFENSLVQQGFDPVVGHLIIDPKVKYIHRHKMLSLKKVQIQEDTMSLDIANSIFEKYGCGELSWKYDGLAWEISYTKGKLSMISTRGSGFEGRNVFEKFKFMFPEEIECGLDLDIRGECILPQNVFDTKYKDTNYSHPRNLASGIVRDETLQDSRKHDLQFIGVESINSKDGTLVNVPKEFLGMWKQVFVCKSSLDIVNHYNTCTNIRQSQEFGTDGLVYNKTGVTKFEHDGHYPDHAIAIKFKPPMMISTITDITWKLHKTGRYVPKIHFSPIIVDGRKIVKATGHNLENLIKNNFTIGTQVRVVLSNDIHPMIKAIA